MPFRERIVFDDDSQSEQISQSQEAVPIQPVELTYGKKRKRDGRTVTQHRNGDGSNAKNEALPRKGTGKLTKFDEEEENVTEQRSGKTPESRPQAPKSQAKTKVTNGAFQKAASQGKPPYFKNQKPSKFSNEEKVKQSQPSGHLLKRRDALLPIRKALPIWPHVESIRTALRKNNVLVLTGETGSGKSTQVPQFLLSESWCTKCIAITQPRRVAAISLARRVAEEMGSLFGSQSPAAKVGYSVRFDNSTGPSTRIKFLTEGMLLQEMLRDPDMEQYSAIIVDEVHERSVNVDLILGFLRNLAADTDTGKRRKHPLKVVVMSATADVKALVRFFDESLESGPMIRDDQNSTKSEFEKSQPGSSDYAVKGKESTQHSASNRVSTCFVEGRQYPVKTIYLPEPTQDWVEAALKLIFQIHYKEPLPGDILVFLTGQDTIESLEKLVNDYAEGMDKEVPKVRDLRLKLRSLVFICLASIR